MQSVVRHGEMRMRESKGMFAWGGGHLWERVTELTRHNVFFFVNFRKALVNCNVNDGLLGSNSGQLS